MMKYLAIIFLMIQLHKNSVLSEELNNSHDSAEEIFLRTNTLLSVASSPSTYTSYYDNTLPEPLPSLTKPIILGLIGVFFASHAVDNLLILNIPSMRRNYQQETGKKSVKYLKPIIRMSLWLITGREPTNAQIEEEIIRNAGKTTIQEVEEELGQQALPGFRKTFIWSVLSAGLLGYAGYKIYQYYSINIRNEQILAKAKQKQVPAVGQAAA